MPINFTLNPPVGNTVTSGNTTWTWNGTSWVSGAALTINADTLDSLDSTAFVLKNGNSTITGDIVVRNNVTTNLVSIATSNSVPIEITKDSNISSLVNIRSFSVTSQETVPTGLFFKPDGTKMYIVGQTGDDINEYDLSSPWMISTATFLQVSANIGGSLPESLYIKPDGTKFYILDSGSDTIREMNATSAWNVATLSNVSTLPIASYDASATTITFKPDGTTLYIAGSSNDSINQLVLTTPWSINTAVNTASFSISNQEATIQGISFNSNGSRMYIIGQTGDDINEYILSSPWDINTASYLSNYYIGFQDVTPTDVFVTPNNYIYILGNSNDSVYQYQANIDGLFVNTSSLKFEGNTKIDYDLVVERNAFVQGTLGSTGTATFYGAGTIVSTLTGQGSVTFSTTTGTLSLGTSQTTGTATIGGTTQTGTITVGQSTGAQTLNLATGATTSTTRKAINFASNGLSGSITTINIGSSISGSTGNVDFFIPNVVFTSANTAQTKVRINGTEASISNATGTLVVEGGVGIGGNVHIGTGLFSGNTFSSRFFAEKANVIASGLAANNTYRLLDGVVHYHTVDSTANSTANLTGFSDIPSGNSVSMAVLVQNGSSPKYISAVQIDGTQTNVTIKWQGGSAPTGAATSNVDVYSFSVIKTAAPSTYTIFASKVQYGP